MKRWRLSALLSLLGVLAAVGAACGGGGDDELIRFGRSLELHVSRPEITDRVAFLEGVGEHRVVVPKASNRQLAVIEVTLVNRTSTVIPLLIDGTAAALGSRRGERIAALDPFESARVVDSAAPNEEKYVPLLWGDVELARDFQVKGWMIFDVPKGLQLGSLFWDEVDDVILDYIDYTRR